MIIFSDYHAALLRLKFQFVPEIRVGDGYELFYSGGQTLSACGQCRTQ